MALEALLGAPRGVEREARLEGGRLVIRGAVKEVEGHVLTRLAERRVLGERALDGHHAAPDDIETRAGVHEALRVRGLSLAQVREELAQHIAVVVHRLAAGDELVVRLDELPRDRDVLVDLLLRRGSFALVELDGPVGRVFAGVWGAAGAQSEEGGRKET